MKLSVGRAASRFAWTQRIRIVTRICGPPNRNRVASGITRHWGARAPKPTIFNLYEEVRDIVSPLELELRYAELDELVSQLIDIMWAFVGALARAHGCTDADWDTAERSFRHALDEQS